MQESTIRNASAEGSFGIAGLCWAMLSYFQDPPNWLIFTVGIGSLMLIAHSAYLWLCSPRAKKEVTDALFELSSRASNLTSMNPRDVADKAAYIAEVRAWMSDATGLLKEHIHDEDVHLFTTMVPMMGEKINAATAHQVVANRTEKLRKITGRYFRGQNIRSA